MVKHGTHLILNDFSPQQRGKGMLHVISMRTSLVRMRFSLVVRASDCQCTSWNVPGFDPSIRLHSGTWGAADEAVLNIVQKKNIPQKILKKGCSVAQLVVRRPAVWQARVPIPARHPREVFPSERNKQWRKGERPRRMDMNECTVWMWLWIYEKDKINKKSGSCHQTLNLDYYLILSISVIII